MFEQPSRRKQRVPLSPEELYYFKKLKHLKQIQKIETFKTTFFYKVANRCNIFLAGFLTYCLLSVLILSCWKTTYISSVNATLGTTSLENNQRAISELELKTTSGETLIVKTDNLFEAPKINQAVFLGKDLLFKKTLKVQLTYDSRFFWNINAYASLTVCCFSLIFGCFLYKINRHLTINGLLVVFGLFTLASFYFILI